MSQLEDIEARVNKATEGPWETGAAGAHIYSRRPDYPMFLFSPHEDHVDGYGNPSEDCDDDARFIAHARTDIPFLLALVREQAAKLDKIAALTAEWHRRYEQAPVGDDKIQDALDDAAFEIEDIINGTEES